MILKVKNIIKVSFFKDVYIYHYSVPQDYCCQLACCNMNIFFI